MSSPPAIEFQYVDFAYAKPLVLEKVSLAIPSRETTCLVGPNGGGKSTLLKLVLGLIEPTRGEVRVLGTSPRKARFKVGYMPQYVGFDPRFPITVREIVLMGRLVGNRWGFHSRKDRAIADQVLEEVELKEFASASFSNLSGGQKQRVLIARALAVEPELLLLDEPTAMVDSHIEARLLEQLKALHQRMTIVMVSHDAAFVANLVKNIICVNRTVSLHPAQAVAEGLISSLYGEKVQSVRHDISNCCGHHHV
jgi:zinc transport system ATP-binding protein